MGREWMGIDKVSDYQMLWGIYPGRREEDFRNSPFKEKLKAVRFWGVYPFEG